MIFLARSTTSSRSSVQAPVDRYFQPPSADDEHDDALVDPLGDLAPRRPCAAPDEMPAKTPTLGQPAGPLDRLAGPHDALAVEQLGAAQFSYTGGMKPSSRLRSPSTFFPAGGSTAQHLDGGVPLLEVAPDAHQRAAGAEPGDEVGDLGAVPPDLGTGALVVRPRVGRVAVLVEEGTTRDAPSASACARRTAPFDPSAPGDGMISAPNTSSSWRRSIDTFSGSTILSG